MVWKEGDVWLERPNIPKRAKSNNPDIKPKQSTDIMLYLVQTNIF